jgi:hypothetical protein
MKRTDHDYRFAVMLMIPFCVLVVWLVYREINRPAPKTCAEAIIRCSETRDWDCDAVRAMCGSGKVAP